MRNSVITRNIPAGVKAEMDYNIHAVVRGTVYALLRTVCAYTRLIDSLLFAPNV